MHFTGTTKKIFREFCSDYQSIFRPKRQSEVAPFVYVSTNEIKLITNLADLEATGDFLVLGVAENGVLEILNEEHS